MAEMTSFFSVLMAMVMEVISQPPIIYFVYIILFLVVIRIVIMIVTLGKGG